ALPALPSFPTRRSSDLSMPGSRSGLTSVRPGLSGRGVPGNSFSVLSGFCAYTPSRLFMPAPHLLNTLGFGVRLMAFNVWSGIFRSEEHTSELQSRENLV